MKTDSERIADADDIIRQKNAKIRLLEGEIRAIHRTNDSAEAIRREIHGLKELCPEPPNWVLKSARGKSLNGVPLLSLSDWHLGSRINKEETGGSNTFDAEVARTRTKRLIVAVKDLALAHMANPQYPGMVVAISGDIINGAIHDELAETNEMAPQQQFLFAEELLIWVLNELHSDFGKLFVPCVIGNHGRDTTRPRFAGAAHHSYEWNLYHQLRIHFRGNQHIRFHIPDETDACYKILDHRFHQTHGDNLGVKGGDGIIGAIGPIARGAFKVGRSEAQIDRPFDTMILGHWHTYMPRGDAIPVTVNGCLCGYNEYARLKLRVPYSRPSQSLAFIHEKYGFTAQWPVYLDEARQESRAKEEWITWSKRT